MENKEENKEDKRQKFIDKFNDSINTAVDSLFQLDKKQKDGFILLTVMPGKSESRFVSSYCDILHISYLVPALCQVMEKNESIYHLIESAFLLYMSKYGTEEEKESIKCLHEKNSHYLASVIGKISEIYNQQHGSKNNQ